MWFLPSTAVGKLPSWAEQHSFKENVDESGIRHVRKYMCVCGFRNFWGVTPTVHSPCSVFVVAQVFRDESDSQPTPPHRVWPYAYWNQGTVAASYTGGLSYRPLLRNVGEYRSVGASVLDIGLGGRVLELRRKCSKERNWCPGSPVALHGWRSNYIPCVFSHRIISKKREAQGKSPQLMSKSLLFVLCARSNVSLIMMEGEIAVLKHVSNISALCYCCALHVFLSSVLCPSFQGHELTVFLFFLYCHASNLVILCSSVLLQWKNKKGKDCKCC